MLKSLKDLILLESRWHLWSAGHWISSSFLFSFLALLCEELVLTYPFSSLDGLMLVLLLE